MHTMMHSKSIRMQFNAQSIVVAKQVKKKLFLFLKSLAPMAASQNHRVTLKQNMNKVVNIHTRGLLPSFWRLVFAIRFDFSQFFFIQFIFFIVFLHDKQFCCSITICKYELFTSRNACSFIPISLVSPSLTA